MTKILRILLALAALIVIVAFAIANRTPVPVSFAPLPILIELPVYGVFLLGLVLGGLIGGLAIWLSGIPQRRQARRMRNKVWALENQVTVLKQQEQKTHAESYSAQREIMAAGTGS
jgi:lipopolysaccharide assembly protein A